MRFLKASRAFCSRSCSAAVSTRTGDSDVPRLATGSTMALLERRKLLPIAVSDWRAQFLPRSCCCCLLLLLTFGTGALRCKLLPLPPPGCCLEAGWSVGLVADFVLLLAVDAVTPPLLRAGLVDGGCLELALPLAFPGALLR